MDPVFWLGLSILLVAVSITAVLMAALPAFQELSRAARSAEKLFDTLNRELPPTLEAIRLTSLEITELTDDMTEGMQNVGRVTQQMDQGVSGVKQQAKQAQITTRSVVAGFKAALGTLARPSKRRAAPVPTRPSLPMSQVEEFEEIDEELEVAEALETEVASLAEDYQTTRTASHSIAEPSEEQSHTHIEEIRVDAAAIDLPEADRSEMRLQNGNTHSPQLRSSSSPALNLPPSSSQTPPQPIESHRDRQS